MKGRVSSKGAVFVAMLLLVVMAGGVAQAKRRKRVMLIRPGKGVGRLSLGDGPAQFNAVFPKSPVGVNNTGPRDKAGCPAEVYYWYDNADNSSKITAYTANSSYCFALITVYGPRFALPDGIFPLDPTFWEKGPVVGTTMKKVEQVFPDGHLYVLTGTGAKWNFGRNLYYWVDRKAGIAFELVWWPPKKQRIVKKISVFPAGADFIPDGCISRPDQYKRIR